VLALAGILCAGCEKQSQSAAPPPAGVTVSHPVQKQVTDFVDFTGNTEASASVDLRARVKGFLKKLNFIDGAMVKEGDLLFEIEPDVYQAELDSAKASLQAAQARLAKAKADLAIKQEMAAGNAASKLDVIQAQAGVDISTAEVALSNARVEQARINLGFTKVYAPLTGRIDRSRIDVGNLVGADGNTLLANIVQASPMYVYADVDEPTVQRVQIRMRQQGIDPNGPKDRPKLPLTLALGTSADFPYSGVIDYVDNKVDSATGTLRIRGVLENKDRSITSGFFARIRVPDGDAYTALLVPERAIGVDQGQKYLLVVNDKNVVDARPVETGSQQGRLRVIKKGLTGDEWVITDGLLRTRPGATVAPERKPIASDAATQPAPSVPATRP
jgi:RND family efflux transporter MFP subunit